MTDGWNWNLNLNKMQFFIILGFEDLSSDFYDEAIISSQIKQKSISLVIPNIPGLLPESY